MTRILVIGNATVDFVFRMARWPAPGETVLADEMTQSPGGKGLNQAVAAARLGVRVELLAPIGQDANASFIDEALRGETGLTPHWRPREAPTDISTIWTIEAGENQIVSSAACARSLRPEELGPVATLASGDILLLQGNLGAETTVAAARLARARGASVLLNTAPIWWDMSEMLSLADLVVGNEPEIGMLAGGTAAEDLAALRGRCAGDIVMTRGARGALLLQAGQAEAFPAPKVEVVNTAGAGDMAIGAIAALRAGALPLPEAIERAMALAARTVGRAGVLSAFPTMAELRGV